MVVFGKFGFMVWELTAQETLGHIKYLKRYKLKVHHKPSFTQNFMSLSIKMRELEVEPECGRAVRHSEAKIVKRGF